MKHVLKMGKTGGQGLQLKDYCRNYSGIGFEFSSDQSKRAEVRIKKTAQLFFMKQDR